MDSKCCKTCELCIKYAGRTRCGLAKYGYMYISEEDPACENYEEFNPESEV